MVGPAAKRAAVAHLQAVMSLSERRPCSIVDADRKMIRYRSTRPHDAVLRGRLRDLANERRRFGYRRLCCGERASRPGSTGSTVFIGRKGSPSASGGPAARLWTRAPILVEAKPNARWSRTSSTTSSPTAGVSAPQHRR